MAAMQIKVTPIPVYGKLCYAPACPLSMILVKVNRMPCQQKQARFTEASLNLLREAGIEVKLLSKI